MSNKGLSVIGLVVLLILALVAVFGLQGLILLGAWNWIAVPLFGFPAATFWQDAGVGVLLTLLGGFFRSSRSSSR